MGENIFNYELINQIKMDGLKRRITKEINQLQKQKIFINIEINNDDNIIIYLIDNDNIKTNIYSFMINNNYPFQPPIVKCNDNYYKNSLHIHTISFLNILKNITGKNCLCCTTIFCRDYWSPTFTIEKIFKEIKEIKEIKKNIIYKFYADKIIDKYLTTHLSLDVYFF